MPALMIAWMQNLIAVFCQKSSDFSIFENRQMSQSRASKNDLGTTRILRKKRRRRKIFS